MSGTRKLRTAVAVVLLLAFLLGLGSACGKSDVVAFYFAVDPGRGSTFDPQIAGAGAISVAVRNIYEGLVYLDERGNPEPGVAESWNISDDGLTYTFHLREGAKWHLTATASEELGDKLKDFSDDVTAYDFVFALRRAVDPATGAPDAKLLENVFFAKKIAAGERSPETLGVFAENAHTLRIRLEKPQIDFLEVLTRPVCMPCPKAFFEATGGRYGLLMKYIISNGPFYMTRFEDTSFRLVRDNGYTGPFKAKTDVIWVYSGISGDAAAQQLSDRDLNGAYIAGAADLQGKVRGSETISADDMLRGVLMNCADDTLKNYNLRKAMVTVANVTTMCNVAGKAPAEAICPLSLSPKTPFSEGDNAAVAQKLLQSALTELQADDAGLTLLCEEQYDASLRYLLQTWQIAFGVKCSVSLKTVTAEELESRVASGDYQMAFYPVQASVYSPAAYFAQFSKASPDSLCSLDSRDYDAAVDALRYCDTSALDTAMRKAEKLLISNAVFLPVWNEGSGMICAQGVKGVILLSGNDRLYLYNAERS